MTRWEGAGLGLLAAPGVVMALGGAFVLTLGIAENGGLSGPGIQDRPRLALEGATASLFLFGLPSMILGATIGTVLARGIRNLNIAQFMIVIAAAAVALALAMAILASLSEC